MPIYLSDREFTERVLDTRSMGKNAADAMTIMARYYYSEGYKKREVRKRLESALLICDPYAQLQQWQDTLDGIVRQCDKRAAVEIDYIPITVNEMKIVRGMDGKQAQRLAFTLLGIAKFWDAALAYNDHWVRTPDREIFSLANINTSIKRQCAMMHDMRECGMLTFRKRVDDLRVRVNYIQNDEPEILLTDYRNLGNQYMMHIGDGFFQCEQCGITLRKKSNSHKYCPACANEIKMKQTVESVTRKQNVYNKQRFTA